MRCLPRTITTVLTSNKALTPFGNGEQRQGDIRLATVSPNTPPEDESSAAQVVPLSETGAPVGVPSNTAAVSMFGAQSSAVVNGGEWQVAGGNIQNNRNFYQTVNNSFAPAPTSKQHKLASQSPFIHQYSRYSHRDAYSDCPWA